MKILFFVFLMLVHSFSYATPKKIVIYFLSPVKTSFIPKSKDVIFNKAIAQNDASFSEQCVPMGEGCFHPQLGFVNSKPIENKAPSIIESEKLELKTFNAIDTSIIDCKKDYHFDIFCGKTSKDSSWNGKLEVWFDISSSLREVDFSKDVENCHRRSFYEGLQKKCDKGLRAAVYNTSIKELGDHSTLCMSYGTNNEKKLVEWIKASNAQKLVIVTDIDELSRSFRDFLEEEGAELIGEGVKPFTVKNLVDDIDKLSNTCR